MAVQVPKVRGRRGTGVRFHSTLLPPYLRRARSLEELIPWLYLMGVSTGDYQQAFSALLGEHGLAAQASVAGGASSVVSARLSDKRHVYWWADGVYSQVRLDGRFCLLVIIGITEHGRKEFVAVEDSYRESEASWKELLTALRERGLEQAPKLATGDGALGFWKALTKVFPATHPSALLGAQNGQRAQQAAQVSAA